MLAVVTEASRALCSFRRPQTHRIQFASWHRLVAGCSALSHLPMHRYHLRVSSPLQIVSACLILSSCQTFFISSSCHTFVSGPDHFVLALLGLEWPTWRSLAWAAPVSISLATQSFLLGMKWFIEVGSMGCPKSLKRSPATTHSFAGSLVISKVVGILTGPVGLAVASRAFQQRARN